MAGCGRKPVATVTVMKRIAQTVEAVGAGCRDFGGQRGKGGLAVVWRQKLAKAGEPTGLFEVQVGDQQRPFGRPEEGAGRAGKEIVAAERKGNHGPALCRQAS